MVAGVRQVPRVPRVESSTGESETFLEGARTWSRRGPSWALTNVYFFADMTGGTEIGRRHIYIIGQATRAQYRKAKRLDLRKLVGWPDSTFESFVGCIRSSCATTA